MQLKPPQVGSYYMLPVTLSNPVPWQNWMAPYLCYILRMKTLFCGWPVTAHETHTRRRRPVIVSLLRWCLFCVFMQDKSSDGLMKVEGCMKVVSMKVVLLSVLRFSQTCSPTSDPTWMSLVEITFKVISTCILMSSTANFFSRSFSLYNYIACIINACIIIIVVVIYSAVPYNVWWMDIIVWLFLYTAWKGST